MEHESLLRQLTESVIQLQELVVVQQKYGQIDPKSIEELKKHNGILKQMRL